MKKYLFVLSAITLILYSCGTSKSTSSETTPTPTKDSTVTVFENPNNMDEYAMGRSIYQNQCTLCHAAKNVTDYSAEEWDEILPNMIARLNKKLGTNELSREQQDELRYYINTSLQE